MGEVECSGGSLEKAGVKLRSGVRDIPLYKHDIICVNQQLSCVSVTLTEPEAMEGRGCSANSTSWSVF